MTIVSDNGTELTSMAILRWQEETNVAWQTRQAVTERVRREF